MAAKKDKMIPSEKERKRALKYATPAGTGRMWVTMGIAFIIFGIILLLIPIGLVISEASAQRYDPESIHTATLVFYLLGAFFGFCGCFCVIFGKLAVKAFAKILCKGEINYPVAEYKTPKKLLLQEAAAINQSPNAPLTASTFGNWIDFEADWQNCLSIYNGILQSHQIFKKLILVQDNFTYKELDYENNSELGVGVKTFAAGSTTTIGKMKNEFKKVSSPQERHDYVVYKMHEDILNQRYHESVQTVLAELKKVIPRIELTGQWSVDVMRNGNDYYIIDMALAENSALNDCVPSNRLRAYPQQWLPGESNS